VQSKLDAAKAIVDYLARQSVEPDQVNQYLDKMESSPLRQKVKLDGLLIRPNIDLAGLRAILPNLDGFLQQYAQEFVDLAEINLKYEGYIRKEQEMVDKMNRLEEVRLWEDLDYHTMPSLSSEAREKLSRMRPRTIGQASRISGISPSDISVLLVHIGR
jgi:tRNA uridine 5-carboxymethylaminomethyl modification enzyme